MSSIICSLSPCFCAVFFSLPSLFIADISSIFLNIIWSVVLKITLIAVSQQFSQLKLPLLYACNIQTVGIQGPCGGWGIKSPPPPHHITVVLADKRLRMNVTLHPHWTLAVTKGSRNQLLITPVFVFPHYWLGQALAFLCVLPSQWSLGGSFTWMSSDS